MGAACCVAVKDKSITNVSQSEDLHRNFRCSPSWSLRWDNRGRVAGEDTSVNCLSNGVGRNDGLEIKSGTTVETANALEARNPSDRTLILQKSRIPKRNAGILRLPSPDVPNSRNVPTEMDSAESPAVSDLSPIKLSSSVHSISSMSPSPSSSRSHQLHGSSTLSKWPRHSPGPKLLRQVSDSQIPELKSQNMSIAEETSFVLSEGGIESAKRSNDGSSDSWSIPAFSEFVETSHGERWSFESESLGFIGEMIPKSSSQLSVSPSCDMQPCGVCSKLLIERSSWAANELAAVAVLICGHVYHAECLENMTPEINKYDPACPVCTLGEKQALKVSGKASRGLAHLKARNKRSKNQVVNSDFDGDSVVSDGQKSSVLEGKGLKMISSSSMKKSSLGKSIRTQHFSFGSKGAASLSENHSTRKKGLFWSKSSKE